jgi:hypothetical protein
LAWFAIPLDHLPSRNASKYSSGSRSPCAEIGERELDLPEKSDVSPMPVGKWRKPHIPKPSNPGNQPEKDVRATMLAAPD